MGVSEGVVLACGSSGVDWHGETRRQKREVFKRTSILNLGLRKEALSVFAANLSLDVEDVRIFGSRNLGVPEENIKIS